MTIIFSLIFYKYSMTVSETFFKHPSEGCSFNPSTLCMSLSRIVNPEMILKAVSSMCDGMSGNSSSLVVSAIRVQMCMCSNLKHFQRHNTNSHAGQTEFPATLAIAYF